MLFLSSLLSGVASGTRRELEWQAVALDEEEEEETVDEYEDED